MSRELTNLLPRSRVRALRRQYFARLAAVALTLLAIIVIAQALLLIPTYLYAHGEKERLASSLAAVDAAAQSTEEQALKNRTTRLTDTAKHLAGRETAPAASAALRAVLAVPRSGVSLAGFTFTGSANGQPARMGISGTAASRDSLRQYEAALRELPFVSRADLPISAYAKERDIPFTIVLTGSLKP